LGLDSFMNKHFDIICTYINMWQALLVPRWSHLIMQYRGF